MRKAVGQAAVVPPAAEPAPAGFLACGRVSPDGGSLCRAIVEGVLDGVVSLEMSLLAPAIVFTQAVP